MVSDLLEIRPATIYPLRVDRTFKQRLGDRYTVQRVTVAKLSIEAAKKAAGMDRQPIKDIEDGVGNPGIDSYERYAVTLGTSFEQMCREAMREPSRAGLDPDERHLLAAYENGNMEQREALRMMSRSFRPWGAGATTSTTPAPAAPETAPPGARDEATESDLPARRIRGRR
jgi:hypothetical protein